jgi:hypothetical protein
MKVAFFLGFLLFSRPNGTPVEQMMFCSLQLTKIPTGVFSEVVGVSHNFG